jgi:hypothetical protein
MGPAALVKLTVYESPPRGDAGGCTQLARFRRAGHKSAPARTRRALHCSGPLPIPERCPREPLRSTLVRAIENADEAANKLRRLELFREVAGHTSACASRISASSATTAINAARSRSRSVMPPQRQAAPTVPSASVVRQKKAPHLDSVRRGAAGARRGGIKRSGCV